MDIEHVADSFNLDPFQYLPSGEEAKESKTARVRYIPHIIVSLLPLLGPSQFLAVKQQQVDDSFLLALPLRNAR